MRIDLILTLCAGVLAIVFISGLILTPLVIMFPALDEYFTYLVAALVTIFSGYTACKVK